MNFGDKRVAVLGGGIAGLSAAEQLARWGIEVTVLEKASAAGGHAIRYVCKATDACAKCGACLVAEKLEQVLGRPNIAIHTGVEKLRIEKENRYILTYTHGSRHETAALQADAVVAATGFKTFDPKDKPYGYGLLADVVTNLEMEELLRRPEGLMRPSDGRPPARIGFIQCVGSRDASLGHVWCSQVCCGSALRMARLIRKRWPGTAVSFFYIDVQTFGKDFEIYYRQCRGDIEMVRAIPADIVRLPDGSLKAFYFDAQQRRQSESLFDMIVLSVGMLPGEDTRALAAALGLKTTSGGFFDVSAGAAPAGVFIAGSAMGPMSIADCIDSAGKAAAEIVRFLGAGG